MKKNRFAILISFIVLLFAACGEDFLEVESTSLISADQIAEIAEFNPGILGGTIRGLYFTMVAEGTGGTTRHYDFGQRAYDIWTDMQCGDMVLGNKIYGWYSDASDRTLFRDHTRTDLHYMFWRYYYRIIFAANSIIKSISNPDGTIVPERAEGRHNLGQALAMRGYAYYHLATYLSTAYTPSELITPIYKDTEDEQMPRSTQQQVWDLIISDLNLAVTYLDGFTRSSKETINQDVAKGMLAYAYAWKGDNQSLDRTFTLTKEVIESGRYPIMTAAQVLGGFNNVNTPGWMWGYDITAETGLGLISWWGQVDYYSYSYAAAGDPKVMSTELFAQIPAGDVRRQQFFNNPGHALHLIPFNKFYDAGRVPMGASRIVTADYVFMRISEMYLLHAEAAARLGRYPEARTALKALLAQRLTEPATSDYIDELSGQALLDEILLQTRKELWGEGQAMTAIKRHKVDMVFGSNHMDFPGATFSYDDITMTFKIPENEILNNPNL